MKEAIDAVEEAFKQFALGNVKMPGKSSILVEQNKGVMWTMPAYIGGGMNALGQKVVTVYPENPAKHKLPTTLATIELLNPLTGECLAVMDGTFLTAMRTGAVGGVAAKYLARTNSATVAIFGAGVQAETQLESLAEVRRIDSAKVFDNVTGRAKDYCERMSKKLAIDLEEGADPRDTLRGSDIVICASTSRVPVFSGEWLEFGMHTNAVGSYTPDIRELDTTAIRRSKVIVDSRDAALREAGDLVIPIAEKVISAEHIRGELGQVILGKTEGRSSDQEITLFKSVGLALQDVSTALVVYKKALEQNKGTNVRL
jgi:ornithine cyclodeaminase/alanine dehydrogenase